MEEVEIGAQIATTVVLHRCPLQTPRIARVMRKRGRDRHGTGSHWHALEGGFPGALSSLLALRTAHGLPLAMGWVRGMGQKDAEGAVAEDDASLGVGENGVASRGQELIRDMMHPLSGGTGPLRVLLCASRRAVGDRDQALRLIQQLRDRLFDEGRPLRLATFRL